MAPSNPPSQIALKVKVPPGYLTPTTTAASSTDSEQFNIGIVPVTTTVGALRAQIQVLVPTHPSPDHQRILYGGRALVDNEQTIGDALNVKRDPTQEEYVVHLLIKGDASSQVPTPTLMSGGRRTVGSVPVANAGSGPPSEGQPTQLHDPAHVPIHDQPQGHTAQQPSHHAMQSEIHQQMVRQHMQAHGTALFGQGFPGTGLPQMAQFQGMPFPPQMAGQQGPLSHFAAGPQIPNMPVAGQNTAQPNQTQPPQQGEQPGPTHQRVGQGFHVEGIGPDGQRFQIHQQTLNFPAMPMPGLQPFNPFGMGFPGAVQPPLAAERPANASTALDQARENLTEMRRMLDEMATQAEGTTDDQARQRLRDMQQRARSLNEYIDPLTTHNTTPNHGSASAGSRGASRTGTPRPTAPGGPTEQRGLPRNLRMMHPQAPPGLMMPPPQLHLPSPPPDQVTAYLLASPQGPQALLLSPEHGSHTAYTGAMPSAAMTRPTPTASTPQPNNPFHPAALGQVGNNAAEPPAAVGAPADPIAQVAQQQLIDGVNAPAAPAANGEAEDPLGIQAILGHFWLLFRILVFAYFLLGSNMGWQRPIVLAGIGLVYWLFRLGVLGDGGVVRRWWDGVVGAPRRPLAEAAQGQDAQQAAAAQGNNANANPLANVRQAMPTPEQVAQRLLHEAEARQQEQRGWLRQQIRPVERAVALFVASLWPGIGEGHVRELRRQQEEEETAARRRAQEEEESRKREAEAQAEGGEKTDHATLTSTSTGSASGKAVVDASKAAGGSG